MKKKSIENNIQTLTSERDELFKLINDLHTKWIEKNKRKYKKISRRLMDLNNTVDNEIRIVSLHDNQRKNLEDLQNELLVMNWLFNQYKNPKYYQNTQLSNQSQQNYNQERTENDKLNEEKPQIIEVSDNGASWKSWWNWNTLRTLWWAAAWIWLWVLIYKWFKKLFWKEDDAEKDKEDEKDTEEENNNWQDNAGNDNKDWNDNIEELEESGEYDEALVKRYKEMEQTLKQRWEIKYTDSENWVEIKSIGLGIVLYTKHLDKTTTPNKWNYKYYTLQYSEGTSKKYPDKFSFNDWTNNTEKISNEKLKEILDMYDNYIRKYG